MSPAISEGPDTDTNPDAEFDCDVVVVGGGPAGCSAGVFTARYGLETLVFDRGNSSLGRCAHLSNYLGFPAGIDIETLYGLMHDHAREAGCEVVSDLVETVTRDDDDGDGDGVGFVVETQDGRRLTARFVVAATRQDGEYMRGLDDDDAMFVSHEHGGEEHEHFDDDYAESDGTTPVDGLFVASPYGETSRQAISAAGHGARVGVAVVEAVRRDRGYPGPIADYYDWVRRETELTGEWSDRDRWREYFRERLPDDHGLTEDELVEIREREIDRRFEQYVSAEEIERRRERAHRRLLDHVDDDLIVEAARDIEARRSSERSG